MRYFAFSIPRNATPTLENIEFLGEQAGKAAAKRFCRSLVTKGSPRFSIAKLKGGGVVAAGGFEYRNNKVPLYSKVGKQDELFVALVAANYLDSLDPLEVMPEQPQNKHAHRSERIGDRIPLRSVLPYIAVDGEDREYNERSVHTKSIRLQCFATTGTICCFCGLQATHFATERHINQERFHLNMYGDRSDGLEVLFTKDHITPKSLGGKDLLSNMQTSCEICNSAKGNQMNYTAPVRFDS